MTIQGLSDRQSAGARSLPRIAVVGRGFSGMMMAIALMNTVRTPFHLHLFDPNSCISGGQALSSGSACEILNSRVRDLSVSADDPDDFADWLCGNAAFRASVPAAIPGFQQIFVPKGIFSDYVYQRFSEALALRRDITVQVSHASVTAIRRAATGFLLESEVAVYLPFQRVVLATGYGTAASRPAEPGHGSALSPVRSRRLVTKPHVVLLGSGLTVVDRLLKLRDGGYAGQVTILSRQGFLPQPHTRRNADPVFPSGALPARLSEMLRFVRTACREAEASGQNWQSVMNGLRRHARGLWRAMTEREKQRFNRHLRALYDSHRNRLPEALHVRLTGELSEGRTVVRRGHFLRQIGGACVVFRPAGQWHEEEIGADQVLDCRCQAPDLSAPMIRRLFMANLAQPDEIGLGIAVGSQGMVLVGNRATDGLFAIGPLGMGSLPDIDLVPEIVSQAYGAAGVIAEQFHPGRVAV